LSSKLEVLSTNLSITKKKKKEREKQETSVLGMVLHKWNCSTEEAEASMATQTDSVLI
jgi:hypothetical protein